MEEVPISDLCDERGLQSTVFYRCSKEFFENEAAAFQQRGRSRAALVGEIEVGDGRLGHNSS